MRNISFALTTQQFRNRSKYVTRRLKWEKLQRGDVLQGVVKAMGLKQGEKIEPLGKILVLDARRESLDRIVKEPEYGEREVALEGFPGMSPGEFVGMFCEHMKTVMTVPLTRIEYQYIDEWDDYDCVPLRWSELLKSMLGMNRVERKQWGYRNRFFAAVDSDVHEDLKTMQRRGLVISGKVDGRSIAYWATILGCKAAGLHPAGIKRAFED